MTLHAFLLAFLAALNPQAPKMHDTPAILSAVEQVVAEEKTTVFGSKNADAIVLTATAFFESGMRLHAVGDHGTARGAWQVHSSVGNGNAQVQARAALGHLRRDKVVCHDMPVSAFVSGNCSHGRKLARYRMTQIMRALKKARLA